MRVILSFSLVGCLGIIVWSLFGAMAYLDQGQGQGLHPALAGLLAAIAATAGWACAVLIDQDPS